MAAVNDSCVSNEESSAVPHLFPRRAMATGILLIFSVVVELLGRVIAYSQWQGEYQLSRNIIGDFGTMRCMIVNDIFGQRAVCSPGHWWYIVGSILSGLAIAYAAAIMLGVVRNHQYDPLADRKLGWALYVTGILTIAQAMTSLDALPVVSFIIMCLHWAAQWCTMVVACIRVVMVRCIDPLAYLPGSLFVALTGLITFVSIVAFVMFLITIPDDGMGIFQHISMDSLALWLLMLGSACVMSKKDGAAARAAARSRRRRLRDQRHEKRVQKIREEYRRQRQDRQLRIQQEMCEILDPPAAQK